ncbi:MAG: hypothetical protein D4R76_02140 [Methylococcus sp.]|nr:MAG: hypothetical protein D4R76_02140 [Methylococcus sp.]
MLVQGGNFSILSDSITLSHGGLISSNNTKYTDDAILRLYARDTISLATSSHIQALGGDGLNGSAISIESNFLHLGAGTETKNYESYISDYTGGAPSKINIVTHNGILLERGASIRSYSSDEKGGKINIEDGGGLFIVGTKARNSALSTEELVNLNNKSSGTMNPDTPPQSGGEIHVNSKYIYLNRGTIVTSTFGRGGSIDLNVEDIFAKSNTINNKPFFSDGNIPKYTKGGKGQYSYGGNYIVIVNNGGGTNVAISGSLLNLSGAMANLGMPSYESDALSNSCDVIDKGSLMSGGKGGKGLNAMDRMIFGE